MAPFWIWRKVGEPRAQTPSEGRAIDPPGQVASSTRLLSRPNLALPYICFFRSLSLLTCPSTCPLDHGSRIAPTLPDADGDGRFTMADLLKFAVPEQAGD